MHRFSQQERNRGRVTVTSSYVEHFIRRMRVVGQGELRTLQWLEGFDCLAHELDRRAADINDPHHGEVLSGLDSHPGSSHRRIDVRLLSA